MDLIQNSTFRITKELKPSTEYLPGIYRVILDEQTIGKTIAVLIQPEDEAKRGKGEFDDQLGQAFIHCEPTFDILVLTELSKKCQKKLGRLRITERLKRVIPHSVDSFEGAQPLGQGADTIWGARYQQRDLPAIREVYRRSVPQRARPCSMISRRLCSGVIHETGKRPTSLTCWSGGCKASC